MIAEKEMVPVLGLPGLGANTPRPEFTPISWLPIRDLRGVSTYQRVLKPWLVRKIVDNFDARLFGAVTIARYRDGRLGCGLADGRHRIEALALLYPDRLDLLVPCWVVEVEGPDEEATLFERLNRDRAAVNTSDIFHSRLDRKEPEAVGIASEVASCDWTIDTHAPAPVPWNTLKQSHGAEVIFRRQPGLLADTLQFLNATWPDQAACHWEKTLSGVSYLLQDYRDRPGWDEELVQKILGRIALRTVLRDVFYGGGGGPSRARAIADHLARVYNENRDKSTPRLSGPPR